MKRTSTLQVLLAAGALAWLGKRLLRSQFSYAGKVVLITGGSRGLGLALARRLAKEGASLALIARDRAELDRACADLARRGAQNVLPIACDVRRDDQAQAAIAEVVQLWGRLDVLINNAGTITVGPFHTLTQRDFEEAMALHFWAPLFTMQAALPHLRHTGDGRIVNISSFGGKLAVPHMASYCASKFALVGLSDAVRGEVAESGVRVTTVCPGLLRTGSHLNAFFKGAHEEEYAWFAAGASVPGGAMAAARAARQIVEACRVGQPQLIISLQARAAVFLQALFPNLMAQFLAQVNRYMPHSVEGAERKSGWDSRGRLPAGATRRADAATEDLNGLRGHPSAS